ncbi:hypothetical protein P3W33_12360 [Luteibacter sp. PPL552]
MHTQPSPEIPDMPGQPPEERPTTPAPEVPDMGRPTPQEAPGHPDHPESQRSMSMSGALPEPLSIRIP